MTYIKPVCTSLKCDVIDVMPSGQLPFFCAFISLNHTSIIILPTLHRNNLFIHSSPYQNVNTWRTRLFLFTFDSLWLAQNLAYTRSIKHQLNRYIEGQYSELKNRSKGRGLLSVRIFLCGLAGLPYPGNFRARTREGSTDWNNN